MRTLLLWLGVCLVVFVVVNEAAKGGRRRTGGTKSKGNIPIPLDSNSRSEYYNNPKGANITMASHFDYEYVLGHKVVFICVAKGTPRPHITWFKDGMELYAHPYLQIHEWKIGNDKIKSKMEIDPATQMDAGGYECHANNKYAIDRRSFRADFSISEWASQKQPPSLPIGTQQPPRNSTISYPSGPIK